MIVLSTVIFAFEKPLSDPESKMNKVLHYCDIFFTTFFGFEALVKIVSCGLLINGKESYLRNAWNSVDFLIFLVSAASLTISSSFGFMKVLRLIRVLRPLRMINRNEGLKVAVLCLFNSIVDVINVIIISILFFALFAIFGVNYFKGSFKYCEG